MWRAHFYEKSPIGDVYKWIVGTAWIALLCGAAWNHVTEGVRQFWALPILLLGFVLFLVAKISVIRGGTWLSFGATVIEKASRSMKFCYVLGYLLMILGFIFSFKQASL